MTVQSLLVLPNHGMIIADDEIGLEKAEADLIDHSRKSGYDVGVAALSTSNANTALTGRLKAKDTRAHNLSLLRTHHGNPVAKILNYLFSIIKIPFVIIQYDAIYAFFPGHMCFLVCLWARVLRRPYGLYVRCNWLKENKTPFFWQPILANANFMIATGEAFQNRLKQYTSRVVIEVPLTPMKALAQIPQRPDPSVKARLVFVGRICESKGLLDIIRALYQVKFHYPNVTLSIAGGGTDEEKLAIYELVEKLRLREQVKLLGHLNTQELATLYTEADIMVFPSYYAEGFPRVLYEAMMYGLPIITCPMPGTQGFLEESIHCLYCQPKNPDELALKIIELLDSHARCTAMGQTNLETVKNLYRQFEFNSHVEQLIDLLKSTTRADAGEVMVRDY